MGSSGTSETSKNLNECVVTASSLALFIFQLIIILVVVCTSIYNLTYPTGDTNMWTALLSSSIGYVLPNPKLKYVEK